MSFLLTHPALAQLFERLLPDYRIMAPAAEYRGGRFSDTDNVTYHSIRHPADLVWQEKSHFSPKEVVLPITQTLFHFDNLEPVSYTHLTLPTIQHWCRSRWSPYH